MIYLKFMRPGEETVQCSARYSVVRDDVGVRVYYAPGMYERLSCDEWRNCFVMSETGKTIDKINAA